MDTVDKRLRDLERQAATGDTLAVARLEQLRDTLAGITTGEIQTVDPLNGNPLADYEGDIWRTVTEETQEHRRETGQDSTDNETEPTRWATQETTHYNGATGAQEGNLIPVPYTSDDDSTYHRANIATIQANYGGECCGESAAGIDGCHCAGPCIYCKSNGPNWDTREGMNGCHNCKGTGQRVPDSTGSCDWLEIHGILMVRVSPYPCGCIGDDSNPWACERGILETLDGLASYPVINDELYSAIETSEQESCWENWGKQDLAERVQKDHPEADLDNVDWDEMLYGSGDVAQQAEAWPTGGDEVTFPLDSWAEAITIALLVTFGGLF